MKTQLDNGTWEVMTCVGPLKVDYEYQAEIGESARVQRLIAYVCQHFGIEFAKQVGYMAVQNTAPTHSFGGKDENT